MFQWEPDDDDNDSDDSSQEPQSRSGKDIRAQLEKTLRENAKLKAENQKLVTEVRQNAIATVLAAKGVKSKVAKLMPPNVEPTEEAVTKWLEEFGDVFAAPKVEGDTPDVVDDTSDTDNADLAAQMGKLSEATSSAKPPAKEADLLAKMNATDMTREKLLELIGQHGGGYGVG